MPESGAVALSARALSKTYRMGDVEVRALRDVDLDLYEGELVVLLGPSGSGKSTLLNILGGLDVPSGGTVAFRGVQVAATSEASLTRYRRDHVGFVFQFYNLISSLTAYENVAMVTEIARNPIAPETALAMVASGRPPGPLPVATVRRRAAAGGDCQGDRQTARHPVVR